MKTKNFICILICALLFGLDTGMAQVPEAMNYQGVLRDDNGEIQANQTVDVRFTILSGGSSVFTETHSGISTNDFGLITLKIGTQNTTDFGMIDWTSGTKELQVEVDAGNGFEDLGTSELLSVPYALQAGNAVGAWDESGSDLYYDNGNVGIGTASPDADAKLHLFDSNNDADLKIEDSYPFVEFHKTSASGNAGLSFYDDNGDYVGWIMHNGADNGLKISAEHTNNATDQLYLSEPGNVGIGTTSPAHLLDVDGTLRADTVFIDDEDIIRKSLGVLSIDADFAQTDASLGFDVGNNNADDHWDEMVATDFITFSDKNVKKDIKALNYGLNDIMQLNPVSYVYKNTPGNEVKNGLIAQEVLKVYPEAVNQHDWDYNDETGQMEKKEVEVLGISYGEFVPLLIKGMQEQQATIKDLEAELTSIRAEIENLKNQ